MEILSDQPPEGLSITASEDRLLTLKELTIFIHVGEVRWSFEHHVTGVLILMIHDRDDPPAGSGSGSGSGRSASTWPLINQKIAASSTKRHKVRLQTSDLQPVLEELGSPFPVGPSRHLQLEL